jgi:adenylate kinase
MLKLLFIGVPGSGKGTQAKLLAEEGFKQLSTGDIIREAFQKNDPLIKPYEAEINKGGLLPDKITLQLIEKTISSFPKETRGIIFDGAVRTIDQAKYFIENRILDGTLFFTLLEEQAKKRLESRGEGREDDAPEAIEKRFQVYNEKTKPILKYLKSNAPFHEADASGTIGDIHLDVKRILNIFNSKISN